MIRIVYFVLLLVSTSSKIHSQNVIVSEFRADGVVYQAFRFKSHLLSANIMHYDDLQSIVTRGNHYLVMETGYFDEQGTHIGLLLSDGKHYSQIDLSTTGVGNFYLQPNGVLIIEDGIVDVLRTEDFNRLYLDNLPRVAIQSGPMLIVDGALNPIFNLSSNNMYKRTAIGIVEKNGFSELVILTSMQPVNLFAFSVLMSQRFNVTNALLLGSADTGLLSDMMDDVRYLPERPFYLLLEWN